MASVFDHIPGELPDELIETIVSSDRLRIERIVSKGHASPEGFWYDQEDNEFVLVLQGSAGLRFEGRDEILIMRPGDYVTIDARARHRVEWTDPTCATIWLAVHYS